MKTQKQFRPIRTRDKALQIRCSLNGRKSKGGPVPREGRSVGSRLARGAECSGF